MIRTAIISVTASIVLIGAWTINLVSYHPTIDLNPLAPLNAPVDWKVTLSRVVYAWGPTRTPLRDAGNCIVAIAGLRSVLSTRANI